MKRFFACSLAFLSTLAFSTSVMAAPKTPEIYFYPSGQWQMDSVMGEHDGLPHQTCSINAAFNNGFFMQINGDKDWVKAMDIDFQQNIFEAGQLYDISLSIPGLNTQNLKAQATSAHNLNIGLSESDSFYKDLRNSSVLDFKMDDNFFRFYMVGLSNEAGSFEKCLAQSTVTAKQGYVDDVKMMAKQPKVESTTPSALTTKSSAGQVISSGPSELKSLMEKRSKRTRLSERIEAQMQNHPDIVSDEPQGTLDDIRIDNNKPDIMPAVPSSSVSYEDLKPKSTAPKNQATGTSRSERADFDFYTNRISDPPAPDWNSHDTDASATGAPSNLLMPPGYNERP